MLSAQPIAEKQQGKAFFEKLYKHDPPASVSHDSLASPL